MTDKRVVAVDALEAAVLIPQILQEKMRAPEFRFLAEHFRPMKSGRLRKIGETQGHNLVTTEGGNDLLDKYFKGSSYTAAWYLGLKGTGSPAAGHTAAQIGGTNGWSEITAYTAGTRPAITFGTTSAKSNTATAVAYTINGTTTIYGAFAITNNTKGGTTGILYSASDFAASRSLVNNDVLNVTLTVSI